MARDMTKAQFTAALRRNGLSKVLMWISRNPEGGSGLSGVGMIYTAQGKPLYRLSLAYALKRFREDDAERARKRLTKPTP